MTEIGQLYAIAGSSQKVGLCQYIKEYSKMTQVEKRGIAGAYKKGCGCEVRKIKLIKNLFLFRLVYNFPEMRRIVCFYNSNFRR